ncbi:hypothetical protein SLNSH_24140 [Alsobacter soli]|uniref:DUF502 domain-containing protein n=1 Tax=Alsobacter soli TaxID=2109933 RepID=A0A2T1HLB1_9HYPH|nr:DUF502 domain-containing protein [Alsobacter soli]PSC02434.1 hypothetical protein SLNSH_24140 [Alsobacter soli]
MSTERDETAEPSLASAPFIAPVPPPKRSASHRLRAYFLTGVVVAGPLAITAYITWWFINLVDGWVKPFIPATYLPETYLNYPIPGFGLIVALIGLTVLGFLTANLVGRSLLDFGETLLGRMPVVRGLYKSMKQIFETVFSQSGTSFRTVGLVQFPAKDMWSIVFLSTPPQGDLAESMPGPHEYVAVFMPCTPNPTTGFFFYVPRHEVIELSLTVDEGAKLIMSAGLIQPDGQKRLARLAAEGRRLGEARPSDPETKPAVEAAE